MRRCLTLLCSYPDNVVKAFVKEARKAGIDIFRVFDSLNYVDNILFGLDAVHAAGGVAEGTICYTGDIMNPARKKVSSLCADWRLVTYFSQAVDCLKS